MKETISIAGCGWFGIQLAKNLLNEGYKVKGSTTTPSKIQKLTELGIDAYLFDINENGETFSDDLFKCNLLVLNIPPRNNTSERHSFIGNIEKIIQIITKFNIPQVIFVSSTSVYGDPNQDVNEFSLPHPDSESGMNMLKAENLLKHQQEFTTTILRFGGLLGPGRNPGRFLSGKTGIPNGKAPVNLIHLIDCVGITIEIIKKKAFGFTYNACAPDHPTRQTFYTKAALLADLPAPLFSDELKQWKIVSSIEVSRLLDYSFQLPKWEDWINPNNL